MTTKLVIQTALKNGRTYLDKAYTTSPLKVADITENKTSGRLDLMIMSSSPGILDGDEYHLEIEVAANCSLRLQTQSYQRLFNMQKGATQVTEVRLKQGSSFTFIPHPVVPHAGSVYKAMNRIHIQEDCTLAWGEVITCGRKLSGEQFQFSKLQLVTDVFVNGKLAIKENLLMEPGKTTVDTLGLLEGYTHQASLLLINEQFSTAELTEKINVLLSKEKGIIYGVSLAPINGLSVRILGPKGEQLFSCLNNISMLFSHVCTKKIPVYAA